MAKSYKYSRSRNPLSLDDCMIRLTDAIGEMERIILEGDTKDTQKIQACHALAGLVNRYLKAVEVHEIEQRLTELEKKLETHVPTSTHWRN